MSCKLSLRPARKFHSSAQNQMPRPISRYVTNATACTTPNATSAGRSPPVARGAGMGAAGCCSAGGATSCFATGGSSDAAVGDGLHDPGVDLVEHLVERCRRFEAEHRLGLLGRGDAPLHVVLERRIRDVTE